VLISTSYRLRNTATCVDVEAVANRLQRGPTKHRQEHKGANLFKSTRISTTRDHKGPNLFTNTRFQ